ncbi:bifunctional DNA primase/polymerase [Streptomyces sp. B1866]|uniref:bifunctional DNA primase/polymerase n=1 Tax=Streptomyces sp. B1866 TaxID=3075431 RepID=UPI0028916DF0|nr:bifunctional DNA primase/polymerase [Streptomyces sp. B1866]MDT3395222.1 bifunctional DNA primase/polymerase [Streptomyces sp. B1866]
MHQTDLLRSAVRAVERGWRVFPLVPGGKRPAVCSWEPRATTDIDRLARCWAFGDFNYGVAAGPSQLVVIDLDVPKHDQDTPPAGAPAAVTDGAGALALLAEQHGQGFPSGTYTVRTPSGGTHLYFSAPGGVELRNTAGALGWKIDTRAGGGYVVGEGSVIGGKPYSVVVDSVPAPLPGWLAELLKPTPLPARGPVTVPLSAGTRRGAYLSAALTAEAERVRRAQRGNRNNALYLAAVALGQLIAGGELGAVDVTDWLTAAALGVGLAEPEARKTIASGLRAGARRPRTVAGQRAAA